MKQGEIWTVAGGANHTSKPRPVVIIRDDAFDATASINICAFTTDETEAPLFRLPVLPTQRNGLRAPSRLMVDKITTVPKSKPNFPTLPPPAQQSAGDISEFLIRRQIVVLIT